MIDNLPSRRRIGREVPLRAPYSVDLPWALVGISPTMERLRAVVQKVAVSDQPVLVIGPSGSGKEPVVRAIHACGPRSDTPFVALNCGAIPESLVESELFGHERSAFTGADEKREGHFSFVGEGTIFLDEIAELTLPLQAKLLRVIETRTFRPLGGRGEARFLGRIVAATNADLALRAAEGRFREDLFFRLNVLPVRVPSLAERREDIPALLAHFARNQPRPIRFAQDAIELLAARSWPGNIRELRTLVERVVVFTDDEVVTSQVVASMLDESGATRAHRLVRQLADAVLELPDDGDRLALMERALVDAAMNRARGNRSKAAELLRVHRKKIERRLSCDPWIRTDGRNRPADG